MTGEDVAFFLVVVVACVTYVTADHLGTWGDAVVVAWCVALLLAIMVAFCIWVGSAPDEPRETDWEKLHEYVMEVRE